MHSLGLAGSSGRSAGAERAEGPPVTPTRTGLCVLDVSCSGAPSLHRGDTFGALQMGPHAGGPGARHRTAGILEEAPAVPQQPWGPSSARLWSWSYATPTGRLPMTRRPHRPRRAGSPLELPATPIWVRLSQTQNRGKNVLLSVRSASPFRFLPQKSFALTEWNGRISA